MNFRLRPVGLAAMVVAPALAAGAAPAAPPVNLAATRPTPAATPGTRVVIPPAVVPTTDTTREVSPSGQVTYTLHAPPIAVCTTFPGTVSLDGAGNVYKQPVETDAHGHQRAVGAPVLLTAPKQTGGVTITAKP